MITNIFKCSPVYTAILPPPTDFPKAENIVIPPKHQQRWVRVLLTIALLSAICLSTIFLVIWNTSCSNTTTNSIHPNPAKLLHCGNSSTQARDLGCRFDILGAYWTPPECYDNETAAEYEEWLFSPETSQGPFPYFSDKSGQHRIETTEALSNYQGYVWTTWEEHLTHCVYVSKRVRRALEPKGVPLTQRRNRFSHTEHCLKIVLDQMRDPNLLRLEQVNTMFTVQFDFCRIEP